MIGDIALEPLANRWDRGVDDKGLLVTSISEIGAVSNRAAITVSDVAQEIIIGIGKGSIEFDNFGANDVYYGGSTVTSASGARLFTDERRAFTKVKGSFSVWLVCAVGKTSEVRIVEYT